MRRLFALPLVASLFALPIACKSSNDVTAADASTDAGPVRPSEVTFPSTFLWGASTAAFQVEKGDSHTDWAHWVSTPGKITNGDLPDVGGADALAHVDEDIALMKAEGHTAYRFSIEWARLYPTRDAFTADTPDAAAITAYTTLLTKLTAAGIKPMVTLMHFALPDWLDDVTKPNDPQGWERPETSSLFVEFASRMAKRFGAQVDLWITLNEPLNLVIAGYIQGSFPPGVGLGVARRLEVARIEARTHAAARDAIKAADTIDADADGTPALVSYAAHQRTWHPYDPTDPDDVAASDHARYVANRWFLNAVARGDWDDDFDGNYDGPNDKRADPSLKGHLDYVGLNYYSDTLISAHRGVVIPILNFAVYQDHLQTGRPRTDLGWDIYPEGFGTVLDEAAEYTLPIYVTENGIADSADVNRARFLAEHLFEMGWAMQRGADIRGYLTWSLVDNFEWANGFCPKFGLHSVDKVTGARTARASATVYSSFIRAQKIAQKDIDAQGAYAAPTPCN